MFVGGGADASRAFGHSDSQPVIHAAPGARLTLRHVVIQDAPGKALGAEEATVVVEDSVIARTDTGGELERSEVHIARSHFFDFPDSRARPCWVSTACSRRPARAAAWPATAATWACARRSRRC